MAVSRLISRTSLFGACRAPLANRLAYASRAYSEFLHPALITRARNLQIEHDALAAKMADGYDSETATKFGRLEPIVEKYQAFQDAEKELDELSELMSDPQLGSDASEEHATLKTEVAKLATDLQNYLVPANEFVDKPCILEIRPGIGGSEAAIFAADLLEMYQNYALKRKWPARIVSVARTPNGGVTEAILQIEESGSYERLQYEGGVHRVQRVPETETKGRVHTSTAAVVVLPDIASGTSAEDSERAFAPGELRIDVMRASGSGGQHVNTTESAVRIVHIPTGIVVTCQDERSQHKNKARALAVLRGRLAERERQLKEVEERGKRSAQVTTTERSDKIRTYNYPQNRLTDHRSGYNVNTLSEVMNGTKFDEMVDAVDAWAKAEAVRALTE